MLAQLARTRMRGKVSALEEAFAGHFTDHHAFLLGKMLARSVSSETHAGTEFPGGDAVRSA